MPLTNITIRKTKPEAKARKLFDERGLFLGVLNTGLMGRKNYYPLAFILMWA